MEGEEMMASGAADCCDGATVVAVLVCFLAVFDHVWMPRKARNGGSGGGHDGCAVIQRKCRLVPNIMCELGSHCRRCHRMEQASFWSLCRLLLHKTNNPPSQGMNTKRKRGLPPNGTISPATRLSAAIRYFWTKGALDFANFCYFKTPTLKNQVIRPGS